MCLSGSFQVSFSEPQQAVLTKLDGFCFQKKIFESQITLNWEKTQLAEVICNQDFVRQKTAASVEAEGLYQ